MDNSLTTNVLQFRTSNADIRQHLPQFFDEIMDLYQPDSDVIKQESQRDRDHLHSQQQQQQQQHQQLSAGAGTVSSCPPQYRLHAADVTNSSATVTHHQFNAASTSSSIPVELSDHIATAAGGAGDMYGIETDPGGGGHGGSGGGLDGSGDGDGMCMDLNGEDSSSASGGGLDAAGRSADGSRTCGGVCKVCGDEATGMYFGALVCVPCKTFFLRYAGDGFSFVCKANKDCEITVATRTQCKYCRYQKCLQAGMYRRVRPAQVQLSAGQQLCVVCHDVANGIHFGAITCEGCKKFFRRGLTEHSQYVCKSGQNCVINPRTRNSCRYCRYQTCLRAGMSREAIQMGRPSKICASDCMNVPQPLKPMQMSPSGKLSTTGSAGGGRPPGSSSWLSSSYNVDDHLNWSSGPHERRLPADWNSSSAAVHHDFGESGVQMHPDDALMKRRHSDTYSASSPYQFSPSGNSSADHGSGSGSCCADSVGERSRISSASSQEILVTNASAPWTNSPMVDGGNAGSARYGMLPGAASGVHRMSGGEILVGNGGNHVAMMADQAQNNMQNFQWHVPQQMAPSFGNQVVHHSASNPQMAPPVCADQVSPAMPPQYFRSQEPPPADRYPNPTHDMNNIIDHLMKQEQQRQQQQPGSSGMNFDGNTSYTDFLSSIDSQQQQQQQQLTSTNAEQIPLGNVVSIKYEDMPKDRQQIGPSSASSIFAVDSSTNSFLNSNHNSGVVASVSSSTVSRDAANANLSALCSIDQHGFDLPNFGGNSLLAPISTNFMDNPCSMSLDASVWIEQLIVDLANQARSTPAVIAINGATQEFVGLDIDAQVRNSIQYWSHPELPDENVMLAEEHVEMLCRIVPRYHWFVMLGAHVNRYLKRKFDVWQADVNSDKGTLSQWIQNMVVPIYTYMSCIFFKSLPGFMELSPEDQSLLVRLGQSQSRILVAALHWYDPEAGHFRNFLSWRESRPGNVDEFKQKLLTYARHVNSEEMDAIEASLLNALVVIASDYPGLQGTAVVEKHRKQILGTFRAYTSAKFGTPNTRLERLFQFVPEVRQLGLLHYKMTTVPSLGVGSLAHVNAVSSSSSQAQ